jgi:hypothetical protein
MNASQAMEEMAIALGLVVGVFVIVGSLGLSMREIPSRLLYKAFGREESGRSLR